MAAAKAAQRGYVDLKVLKDVQLPGQKAAVAPEGPGSTPEWAREGFIRVDQDSTFRGAIVSFKTSKEQSSSHRTPNKSRRSATDARYMEGTPVKVSFDPSTGSVKVRQCEHAVLSQINGDNQLATQSGSPSPNGENTPLVRRKSFPDIRDIRGGAAESEGAVRLGSFAAPTPPKHRTPETSKSAPRMRRHSMPGDSGGDMCMAALAAAANASKTRERIRTGSGSLSSKRSKAVTTFASELGSSRSLLSVAGATASSEQEQLEQLRQDSFKFSSGGSRR